jgi:hypothetical protein
MGAAYFGTSYIPGLIPIFAPNVNDAGLNMLIAGGYTGQTIENFGASDVQEVVGVRIPCYASANVTYTFGHKGAF